MTVLMGSDLTNARLGAAGGEDYFLTVLNQNSRFQQFALFQTIPSITGAYTDPLTLVWLVGAAAAGSPSNPSQSTFIWRDTFQANVGYVQEDFPGRPRVFLTASITEVSTDSHNSVNVTYLGAFPYGAPGFPFAPGNDQPGLINIQSDNTIPTVPAQTGAHLSLDVGIGMDGRPTVVVQLEPNMNYVFTPKPTYYILAASMMQGQVLDAPVADQAFKIDFSGTTNRTVIFTEYGQFENQ